MKYKCLIVDDEKLGRELIRSYCDQFPYLEVAAECQSAIEAIPLLSAQQFDMLFLDINMPALSGIDLLRQSKNLPLTVLCTAHAENALESFDLDVVDYLLKPIEFGRFSKAVARIISRLNGQVLSAIAAQNKPAEKQHFFVKSDYQQVKIETTEILFIEAMEKYIRIHTTAQKVLTLMSMQAVFALLPDHFFRVHRSYIINLHKVDRLDGAQVYIGEQPIPVSKANRKAIKEKL